MVSVSISFFKKPSDLNWIGTDALPSITAANGKLYDDIAIIKRLYVFNKDMYGEDHDNAHRD
ncbi:hypothetical protein Ddye_006702 [Dipteronia dyeriana]|uniref:Uncharacterized protein n=1 Tax=Dipteronia dyeriana TaxID=168575 RepID=A0AAD9XIQ3_9ROSI|nr:hypothetical protein Ddye_006702 [Dipteronia dyeriana]